MSKDQKIIARVIIQMMGSPKKHIEDTMQMYMDKIVTDYKDIEIIEEKRSKAKKDKENKETELFKIYTELEIEAKGIESLVWFCFDYMPSSVEILEPDKIIYDQHDFTDFLNDLQSKLHHTDMTIKNLSAENQVIKKNGMMLIRNIVMLQLKVGKNDCETLATNAGVPVDHMEKFLEGLIKEGKIKKDKDLYSLL
jgi:hypothetical protein